MQNAHICTLFFFWHPQSQLSEQFLALARELDILEPKTPNDVYKTHLESAQRASGPRGETLPTACVCCFSLFLTY